MSKQLSSLDIYFLLKELDILIGSKVSKVYAPSKKHVVLELFVSGKGKHYLKIYAPEYICMSDSRDASGEHSAFCMLLRKYLNNSILKEINQLGSERIIEFLFEAKESKFILMAEFFSKGNIIFCKNDKTIIHVVESHKWKDRTLRGGIKYELPPQKENILGLKKPDFISKTESQDSELVKLLATGLGFGGKYAEELCAIADIGKSKKNLCKKDCEKLYSCFKELLNKKPMPVVVSEKEKLAELLPFDFLTYKDKKYSKRHFKTFNQAIDFFFSSGKETGKDVALQKYEKKLQSLEKIFSEQKQRAEGLKQDIDENKKKGEIIYEKYTVVAEILGELKNARKKYSWKEIKEKLKGHKIIKEINEKEGKVVVEL